jgi:hypothetical protein
MILVADMFIYRHIVRKSVKNQTSKIQQTNSGPIPLVVRKLSLKHYLFALAVPLLILLAGIFLLSVAALLGMIIIIVAIAMTVGIVMAAVRINRQRNLDAEPAQWKTRTLPVTSLILIVGLASLIFFIFAP